MDIGIGVWIDHREAIVVTLTEAGEEIERVDSSLGGALEAHRGVPGDGSRQRALDKDLDDYYDRVVERVRGAAALLIVGPGEAPREFAKRVAHGAPRLRVLGVEVADRVTDPQLAGLIRGRFLELLPSAG